MINMMTTLGNAIAPLTVYGRIVSVMGLVAGLSLLALLLHASTEAMSFSPFEKRTYETIVRQQHKISQYSKAAELIEAAWVRYRVHKNRGGCHAKAHATSHFCAMQQQFRAQRWKGIRLSWLQSEHEMVAKNLQYAMDLKLVALTGSMDERFRRLEDAITVLAKTVAPDITVFPRVQPPAPAPASASPKKRAVSVIPNPTHDGGARTRSTMSPKTETRRVRPTGGERGLVIDASGGGAVGIGGVAAEFRKAELQEEEKKKKLDSRRASTEALLGMAVTEEEGDLAASILADAEDSTPTAKAGEKDAPKAKEEKKAGEAKVEQDVEAEKEAQKKKAAKEKEEKARRESAASAVSEPGDFEAKTKKKSPKHHHHHPTRKSFGDKKSKSPKSNKKAEEEEDEYSGSEYEYSDEGDDDDL
jgi:hypothetical protein